MGLGSHKDVHVDVIDDVCVVMGADAVDDALLILVLRINFAAPAGVAGAPEGQHSDDQGSNDEPNDQGQDATEDPTDDGPPA